MTGHGQKRLRKNLTIRARVIQAIRKFFIKRDYLEIETPVRIPAPAPEAHISAIESEDWVLQTSPELCMKRLLASGYRRIFQICKCFRQAERGRLHLPEMTLLEWYRADSDYQDMMNECEALIISVAQKMGKKKGIVYEGEEIRLTPPWPRISVSDAFDRFGSISLERALAKDQFDEIMVTEIEPALGQSRPVFLYDYPACRGASARLKPQDRRYAERFELYIGGLEICNAFSELTDSTEQRGRFERDRDYRQKSGNPVYPMPEKFLASLGNMPAAAGNALGIDRLVMFFTDSKQIDEVVAFTPEEL
ncbi:MAG: EF-P lysine aminoacylase EpmA [Desulfobacterales bacterium]|jgi:lysyl-tRNA synthetase class 2